MNIYELRDEIKKVNDEIFNCIMEIKSKKSSIGIQKHFMEESSNRSHYEESILKSKESIEALGDKLSILNSKRDGLIDEIHKISPNEKIPEAYYHPKERKQVNKVLQYIMAIVFWIIIIKSCG